MKIKKVIIGIGAFLLGVTLAVIFGGGPPAGTPASSPPADYTPLVAVMVIAAVSLATIIERKITDRAADRMRSEQWRIAETVAIHSLRDRAQTAELERLARQLHAHQTGRRIWRHRREVVIEGSPSDVRFADPYHQAVLDELMRPANAKDVRVRFTQSGNYRPAISGGSVDYATPTRRHKRGWKNGF